MKNIFPFLMVLFILCGTTSAQIGGYAVELTDADDYVQLPEGVYFDDNTFTVETWVYVKVMYSWSRLIDFGIGASNENVLIALQPGTEGLPIFEVYQGGNKQSIKSGSQLPLKQWVHLACVLNGTTAYMYLNGVQVASGSLWAPNNISRTKNYIGLSNWGAENPTAQMKIDEFRIWKTARTVDEIRANMYRELTGAETGLQVYYKMSNGSGVTVTDNKTTGTAYNATLVNGPLWKASGCFAGPRNSLALSRGSSQSVQTPVALSDAIGGKQKITIAGWVKPASLNDWQTFFNHKNPTVDKFRTIIQSGSGGDNSKFCVSVSNGADNKAYTRSGSLVVGKWTHFAVVFDGSQSNYYDKLKIFVNGVQEPLSWSGTDLPTTTLTSSNVGYIGSETDLISFFDGVVDEFSFWDIALTSAQIRDIMMRSLTGNEAGLQAYYRFDETDGTTAFDMTANNRNGTLRNNTFPNSPVASTAFNTWTGAESSSWSDGANWSTGSPSSSERNTGVYKWLLGNELTIDNQAMEGLTGVLNLLIAAGSAPVMGRTLPVLGNLLVDADLNLNGYSFDLGSTGNLLEGLGRLYGNSGTIYATRTLSNISSENVAGLGAVITTSQNMGSTTITRGHSSRIEHGTGAVQRWYNIAPTNNSGLNATLVFNYNPLELGTVTESKLALFKSIDEGVNWTKVNGTVDVANNKITLTGIGAFSLWTAADNDNPLPVELTSFTARATASGVTLNWETKTEVMNAGFEVERKTTTTEWAKIGFVEGHYTTNSPKYYSFTDKPTASGKLYYRLKQINTDGSYDYSNELSVETGLPTEFALGQNYPNPFSAGANGNPGTVVRYALPAAGEVSLKVYNSLGQEVLTLVDGVKEAGNHSISFDAAAYKLTPGVYFYRLSATGVSVSKKMVLLR